MIPVRTMKHIPQMREIPHLNPQRLGNLHETIAPLDKARETAINSLQGYPYLPSQGQALVRGKPGTFTPTSNLKILNQMECNGET